MASGYKDYYAILGVKKDASADDIRRAYRGLAKQHHPDLHPEHKKGEAEAKFKEINEAYEVLSDPEKKARYDQLGPDWQAPPAPRGARREEYEFRGGAENFSGFSDFFESMFGERGRTTASHEQADRGQDIEAELPLSLEEAVAGGTKTLSIEVPAVCPACAGAGRKGRSLCRTCAGRGQTRAARSITARLPRAVVDGSRLRLRGQGGLGEEPGDLYLRIRLLAHPRFRAAGADLEAETTIMPWTAALGGEASVETLDGRVRIKIPPQTHAGRKFRIPGKGLGKEGGGRGDFYAVARIDIPDRLDARAERLLRELERLNGA